MIGARSASLLVVAMLLALGPVAPGPAGAIAPAPPPHLAGGVTNSSPVSNFSASIDRLVTIVGAAGGGLLALVWARVALSWFSNDVTKKVQAKDRARDALIGTLIFVGAVSGLVWALAQWVVTGA